MLALWKIAVLRHGSTPIGEMGAFDPSLWKWKDGAAFFHYSTKRGRELISSNTELRKPAETKWTGEIQVHFSFNWKDPWDSARGKSIWHKAVAVNVWRAKVMEVDQNCDW